jgi:DNA-binding CsgD family transcriptional regulator
MPANGLAEVPLTLREVDVLKWTADGKTAYEISRILNISESTVNFHVKNIVSKMGSSNKIQAVAKAALIGLLR